MKEALRGGKRHEDASVFKAVCGFQNADDVKGAVTDGNPAADAGVEKVSCARAKDNVVVALAEEDAIAGQPCGFANTGIVGRDAEAGNDGVVGAGNDSEQNRICMSDGGPGSDFAGDRSGNIAEEEIGDVALEDDNFTVVRENAREHADGALKNGDHGEHGGDTEGNAGDADEGADAVTAEIGKDQLEEDHGRSLVAASSAISQALSGDLAKLAFEIAAEAGEERQSRPVNEQSLQGKVAHAQQALEALDGGANADGPGDVGTIKKFVARRGFARFTGALQHVLEIVDRLVAESPADGDALKQLDLSGRRAAKHSGKNKREADERDSFAAGDAFGCFPGMGQRGVVKVKTLTIEKAFYAEALFNVRGYVMPAVLGASSDGAPDKSVGAVDESECGEDCGGFAELERGHRARRGAQRRYPCKAGRRRQAMRCGSTRERWQRCARFRSEGCRHPPGDAPCAAVPCFRDSKAHDAGNLQSENRGATGAATKRGTTLAGWPCYFHRTEVLEARYSLSPCCI